MSKPIRCDSAAILNNILALFCLVALAGCASPPVGPPPVFRGVAQELPKPDTRILLYYPKDTFVPSEEISLAEQESIMWFQEHGQTVVERSRINAALTEQSFSMRTGDDRAVLSAGKMLGAQQIVFVMADYTRVAFRAIDTETGRILWSGTGVRESLPREPGTWEVMYHWFDERQHTLHFQNTATPGRGQGHFDARPADARYRVGVRREVTRTSVPDASPYLDGAALCDFPQSATQTQQDRDIRIAAQPWPRSNR